MTHGPGDQDARQSWFQHGTFAVQGNLKAAWAPAKYGMLQARHQLIFPRPRRHLEEAIHVALERLGFQERRDEGNNILAVAPWSWDSWGENVLICLEDLGEATGVTYISQPKLSTTLFDNGKNGRNLQLISEAVERMLSL